MVLSFALGLSLHHYQKNKIKSRIDFYNSHKYTVIAQIKDDNFNEQLKQHVITLHIKNIYLDGYKKKTNDVVTLYTKRNYLRIDDIVYIKDLECAPIKNQRIEEYLIKNRSAGTAFKCKKISIQKRPPWSLNRFIHNIKTKIRSKIKQKLSSNTFQFFSSIFLGKREPEQHHLMKKPFLAWGIMHYLARSGLHLAIIFFITTILINLFSIAFSLKTIFVFLFCLIYALLSWPSISFKRALLLIICYQICHLLKISINSFHLLNLVLLSCILANTQLIFALDFQLTFILTYALILISKPRTTKTSNAKSCIPTP